MSINVTISIGRSPIACSWLWSHDFSANNPPVQALAAALTQPYLWPSAVLLLAAACVAATLQSWPSIIYTRLRTCAHTYTHRACAAYSIPCPGATPDFKLQLAEPEGQVNLQGSSAEVTQTGNNCLSHFFFPFFFFLQRGPVQFCVQWGKFAHGGTLLCLRKRRWRWQIFSRPCSWFLRVFSSCRSDAPLLSLFQRVRFPICRSVCACVSSGFQARLHRLIKSEHVSPGQRFLITFSLFYPLYHSPRPLWKPLCVCARVRVSILFVRAFVPVCACVRVCSHTT